MLKSILMAGVATMLIAPAAAAQAARDADEATAVSEVVVTAGSRIVTNGFQQPTPVTVVGEQELEREMPVTIADYLNELPAFGAALSARNPSISVSGGGAENLNLRSLGLGRTLVLLDNRRVVESATSGGVDTLTLPTSLVQRIEVVTGGASAAWGADAVAGVVNFVLNRNYEGLGLNVQAGVSERGDNQNYKGEITGGAKFAGGRGRIIANVDYSITPDGVDIKDRGWWRNRAVVNNPAYTATNGQPRQITVDWAGTINASTGGVITSGPLRGIQFVGPTGTPAPYNFGFQSGNLQWGGDVDLSVSGERGLATALKYGNVFTHVDFDLTDTVTAYAEFSYGKSIYEEDGYLYYIRTGNIPIQADNAFLDPSIRAQMASRGLANFNLGLTFLTPEPPRARNEREMVRGVIGMNGRINDTWKWGAYFTHGEAETYIETYNNPIVARFNLAVDAVRNPTTGAVVCRSTLTNPTNGCQPLNVFGENVASPQALQYVIGTNPWQRSVVKLDVFSFETSGTVFTLPAGDVSVAFGGEYTRNKAYSTQDELAAARQFATGNFQPFTGKRDVKEVFGETVVPIVRDMPFLKSLELNAAARLTDYSTSGSVTTWKLGLSAQFTDDLRFRVTRSRDIRAPTLLNLFSGGTLATQFVFDPFTQTTYSMAANTRGNPDLKPEDAETWTAGVVYSPGFVEGLTLSVDYYRISIEGAIASVGAPQTLTRCFEGQAEYCRFVMRNAAGTIVQIDSVPTNISRQLTEGWDFEVGYRRPLFDGALSVRALASYVPTFNQIDGAVTRKLAGAVGDLNGSQPYVKGNVTTTYEQGPLAVTLSTRLIGKTRIDSTWKSGVDIDENKVPAYVNFGLTTVYKFTAFGAASELRFAIDNLFDTDPTQVPVVPGTVPYGAPGLGGRMDLYDPFGRSYRIGLKSRF